MAGILGGFKFEFEAGGRMARDGSREMRGMVMDGWMHALDDDWGGLWHYL
jgi:hypothetical protein